MSEFVGQLIGQKAPDFECEAITNNKIHTISSKDLEGSYTVLFFYPLDFTFVCPTEMHALQEQIAEFEKRNVKVCAISVDSIHTHNAWVNTDKKDGGIKGISYSLLSDLTKEISYLFGVLKQDEGVSFRGTFILDKDNIIQHASVNNLPYEIGRAHV